MNMIMNATIINQYSNGQPLIMERYHVHDTLPPQDEGSDSL